MSASPRIELTDAEIRERMSGNICRCAAYPNIVAAIRDVAQGRRRMRPFTYERATDPQAAVAARWPAPARSSSAAARTCSI